MVKDAYITHSDIKSLHNLFKFIGMISLQII